MSFTASFSNYRPSFNFSNLNQMSVVEDEESQIEAQPASRKMLSSIINLNISESVSDFPEFSSFSARSDIGGKQGTIRNEMTRLTDFLYISGIQPA